MIFDLPDVMGSAALAPARTFLLRTALAYLDGLAQEAADDAALLRDLAVAYARVGDVQAGPNLDGGGDPAGALTSHRKSLALFAAIADALPDNAQAQRDLAAGRGRVADLERAPAQACPNGRSTRRGETGSAAT